MIHNVCLYLFFFGLSVFALFGIVASDYEGRWAFGWSMFSLMIAFSAGLGVVLTGGF